MNKTELLKKADELIKKSDELIAKANELKEFANKEEIILVPDEIKINKPIMWYSMWILNKDLELLYNYRHQKWAAIPSFDTDHLIKCKLTPCKYGDLEPWDVFYRSDTKNPDFNDLFFYAIKLDDWSYQYWEYKDCRNSDKTWSHYWKVEPFHLNINKQ